MIPKVSRIVNYIIASGPAAGQVRPAVIVRVWDDKPTEESLVNLQVFTDDSNDGLDRITWRTSVHQDKTGKTPGTWHEPVREPVDQEAADLALLERLEAAARRREQAVRRSPQPVEQPNAAATTTQPKA